MITLGPDSHFREPMIFFRKISSPGHPQGPEITGGRFTLDDKDIAYKLLRSQKRRRTLSLSVESDGSLLIRAPMRTSVAAVERFVEARSRWVLRRLGTLHAQKSAPVVRLFADGEEILFRGETYLLKVTTGANGCVLAPHTLTVSVSDEGLSAIVRRDEIRFELVQWYKKQAKVIFEERLTCWSEILGLPYKKMIVSDPRSLWGSCDAQNVIRLNWRLVMAPAAVLDYVVVHELCHVVHRNHSPRFWRAVEKALPDYAATRKYLRNNAYLFSLPGRTPNVGTKNTRNKIALI